VDRDELSYPASCRGAGFQRSIHRADIASNQHGDVTIEQVFLADHNHAGGLDHGIGGLNRADQAECFDHS
jgi:hypothetical protein